jgi:hypothetical protein
MNNKKKQESIKKRQAIQKDELLDHLRRYPIIQVACEKSHIGRQTYYRWKNEDEEFLKSADIALAEGEELFNDLGEHQLLTLMKDKHWPAIRYWLDKRHPKFNKTILHLDEPVEISFNYNQKH